MTNPTVVPRERLLDPISRISEILFGLIMALTFTGTLSVATQGREDIRALLIGAIGCNIAWGLVDAVMYLIAVLTARGRDLVTIRAVRNSPGVEQAHDVIARGVSPLMASTLTREDIERVRQTLLLLREVPSRPKLTKEDFLGAFGVFLLVVLSTFPLVVPFLVLNDVHLAIRTSHGIAIVLLFVSGYLLARHGGYRPFLTGFSMVVLGTALAAIAIALGG